MENVLKKILEKKKENIKNLKKKYSLSNINEFIKNNNQFIDFKAKLKERDLHGELSIIAEIKKASPSAGVILKDFNHNSIADTFIKSGALFLSVLTEEDFFLGNLNFISDIKKNHKIPILCKDFFIDPYQVSLAKSFGADCILIILSAVDDILAKDLYQAANENNISTLIEVHTEKEAEKSLFFENSIIGINNRNLDTLKVSLETTRDLVGIIDGHKNPLVCESGINSSDDIEYVIENSGIYNFLVGESLLKNQDMGQKFKELTQISL